MDKRDGLQYIAPRNGSNNNYPSKIKSKSKYTLILDQFYSNLRKKISVLEFKENLASCETNVDKINLVSKYFTWKTTHHLITRKYNKNSEISCDFRNVGNAAYHRHCFVEAVKSYNLALLFAAPEKAEVGLAYANRSAALYSLGQVEEALEDIERAVSSNYPKDDPEKWKKLQDRKIRYEEHLKERQSQRDAFECELKEEVGKRSAFCKNMFTLKSPNSMVPAVEDFVVINFNEDRGRHLVAKRDIPIGTTVLVETPFVASLENALNFDLDHCHYCLKQNLTCIPCPNCVFALYCNERCRSEAQEKYHRYECPTLPELHCLLKNDRLLKHFYLVFKLVCIVGPPKLFTIFSKGKLNTSSHRGTSEQSRKVQIISGSDPSTGVYSPDSYRAVYNLMPVTKSNPRSNLKMKQRENLSKSQSSNINGSSNNNEKENDDINENEEANLTLILMCLILSQTLSHYSGFFLELKIHDEELDSEFHNFIAQLMLHHFENFQRHVFELYEFSSKDGSVISLRSFMSSCETLKTSSNRPKTFQFDFGGFATGIFPTLSLLNHSCDPSVARFTGKSLGQTAVVTLKPVRCGEELLISYGPLYGSTLEIYGSSKSRQSILLSGYQFTCNCIACQNDWPSIFQLNKKNQKAGLAGQDAVFSCSFCSVKVRHENKMSYEFLKCKLSSAVTPGFQPKKLLQSSSSSQLLTCGVCNLSFLSQVLRDELNYHKQVLEMCRSLILENHPLQAISLLKSTLDFFARSVCPPNYCYLVASQFYREAVDLIILFSTADDLF